MGFQDGGARATKAEPMQLVAEDRHYRGKQKTPPKRGFHLVEVAGVEPASESALFPALHA